MDEYVSEFVPVGGFLEKIITNDLKGAVCAADDVNVELIPIYVCWFYNEAPSECWGSNDKYAAWLRRGK